MYSIPQQYPDFAMLLGIDFLKQTGHQFYLCVTPEARNFILNPPKKRKVVVDLKKKEEVSFKLLSTSYKASFTNFSPYFQEAWDKLASIVPRKWRTLGSEMEVDAENIQNSRPLVSYASTLMLQFRWQSTVIFLNAAAQNPCLPLLRTLQRTHKFFRRKISFHIRILLHLLRV